MKMVFFLFLTLAAITMAQPVHVPNASFDKGADKPDGWTFSAPKGEWLRTKDGAAIAVTGTGQDMNHWASDPILFEPNAVYRIQFDARSVNAGGGTAVTGPVFANQDIGVPPETGKHYTNVFATPAQLSDDNAWLRFGQWHVSGKVVFDNITLSRVQPVYSRFGTLSLGEGEALRGNEYVFQAPFRAEGSNHCRALQSATTGYNSHRWVFGKGSDVVYRHELAGRMQQSATLEIIVNYYQGGQLRVEASRDGKTWTKLGTQLETGTLTMTLPAALFPAEAIWIRMRAEARQKVGAADSDPGSFQVNSYAYTARVSGSAANLRGRTSYVDLLNTTNAYEVELLDIGDALPGGKNRVLAKIVSARLATMPPKVVPVVEIENQQGKRLRFKGAKTTIVPNALLECAYEVPGTGTWTLRLSIGGAEGFACETDLFVPSFYATNYGALLPGHSKRVTLWSASSGWKIPKTRTAPTEKASALLIHAARNEAEAVQLVACPKEDLEEFTATATALVGAKGATLSADCVDILRVRYLDVTRKTDRTGTLAAWPDPLPPLRAPIRLEAGQNQPLWIRVKTPANARPGLYKGTIVLSAKGWSARVPLHVRVYGFELPNRMTCQTAFGFNPGAVWRYQKLTSEADRRTVLNKYLRNFADHHISPYDPCPLDPFRVSWEGGPKWRGGKRVEDGQGHALMLVDKSETGRSNCGYDARFALPAKGLRLRFRYRMASENHASIATLLHHRADGGWMSGCNNDMVFQGGSEWRSFDRTLTSPPAGAKEVTLKLWATRYSDGPEAKGTVWYDDVSLMDLSTGRELLDDGDFEATTAPALRPKIDWAAWDQTMTKAIGEYGFNTFRMPIQGLGGGTFHARREPSLLGFPEDTPQYQTAMKNYLGMVQAHLAEKGWLEEAFVYWFDEPAPKDYEFVMNGFRRLKTHAPSLRRMLTEQVEDELVGGPNLWCPVSHHFGLDKAQERRAEGDSFWWYVCTGPKAPYCTLFIDHPGTEMRVWLWQTWQRRVKGILVWATNYWTSAAAYPDHPQNPYDDPMGWVSGYDTPRGTRRAWGNGDGRFLYPPEAAADANPAAPVLDGPVDSIRWEMLRDGIEDYEYFIILERLLKQKGAALSRRKRAKLEALLEVPESVTVSMTEFTTDPRPVETRRHEIARAIEALVKTK